MSTDALPGLLGLIFYPSQGVYKSIYEVTHSRTRRNVKHARQVESESLATQHSSDCEHVLRRFEIRLVRKYEQQPLTDKIKLEMKKIFSSRARSQEAGEVHVKHM
jgi:hypothetical protein